MVSSLADKIGCWEIVEYVAIGIITLGVAVEAIELVLKIRGKITDAMEHFLVGASILILVFGLALEYLATRQVNILSARQIAEIDLKAGNAFKSAGEANKSANTARKSTEEVKAKSAKEVAEISRESERLRSDIELSKREQSRLALSAEQLRKENLAATERLEAEKRERLKAEKYLAPRDIGEQYSFGQALSKFKGMTLILDSVTDAECRRLADTLEFSLVGIAQWKLLDHQPMDESRIPGGVIIEYRPNFFEQEGDASEEAARALEGMFKERNISVQAFPTLLIMQPNILHVTIGLKPSPQEEEVLKHFREVFDAQYRSWLHPPK